MRARANSGSHMLSDAEYAERLEAQGGGCAICGATPKTRKLHVDRDHKTLAVRGLLCHRCNRALPSWMTERWLHKAARYLHRADPAVAAKDDANQRLGYQIAMSTRLPPENRP